MNEWSRNRKRTILILIFFVLIVLIGLPLFFLFYRTPTCGDGKQNGVETGVDCGGACARLCTAESLPLILKGDPRVLRVANNTFEVVALVENPNSTGEVYRASYTFTLYDAQGTAPIKIIEGETYVPRGMTFALFEGPFSIESGAVPTRAVLEWQEETFNWQKNATKIPELMVRESKLSRLDTNNPRLDAVVENLSLENISNIDLVALLSNKTGSIFAASKTFVDTLPVGGRVPVVFSWPQPFADEAVDIDIIIRIFPDRSFIR